MQHAAHACRAAASSPSDRISSLTGYVSMRLRHWPLQARTAVSCVCGGGGVWGECNCPCLDGGGVHGKQHDAGGQWHQPAAQPCVTSERGGAQRAAAQACSQRLHRSNAKVRPAPLFVRPPPLASPVSLAAVAQWRLVMTPSPSPPPAPAFSVPPHAPCLRHHGGQQSPPPTATPTPHPFLFCPPRPLPQWWQPKVLKMASSCAFSTWTPTRDGRVRRVVYG